MANKNLFKSMPERIISDVESVNEAGGKAYKFSDQHTLAQFAVTGCFNNTYYATDKEQLNKVLALTKKLDPEFIAKVALYSRNKGFMKDMPAVLLAVLSARQETVLVKQIFNRVIDNGRMLRNYCQVVRSGVTGRKSFGTSAKKLIQSWLVNRDVESLFKDSVGNNPSIADVIKMAHPKPRNAEQKALFAYLIGKEYAFDSLPKVVREYELFKKGELSTPPGNLEFRLLTALELSEDHWKKIATDAPWHMTRMNLNTFVRHNVFNDVKLTDVVASRLANAETVRKVKVFPYQLLTTYLNIKNEVPSQVQDALQDALEVSLENIPEVEGQVYIFPDVSGSMRSPLTGDGRSSTRCVDVAALVSAAFLRKNTNTVVIPFEGQVVNVRLNSRDSVMTNAKKLSDIGGGSTNCSAPLALLNREQAKGDLVIYVSDNESWVDKHSYGRGTGTMSEWKAFKARNPNAKLVCIDLQAYDSTQAPDSNDVLNVGGFSDNVFTVIDQFVNHGRDGKHFVDVINQEDL